MTKRKKKILITASVVFFVILLVIAVGKYFISIFFSSFAPQKITVTKNDISTNRDFINGVNIEKIQVDSIGEEKYPVKYTVTYITSCNIRHPKDKPPSPPSKIEFNKAGKYFWDEEIVSIRYYHTGLTRQSLDTISKTWWLNKTGNYSICPIQFEKEQWYFFTFSDPQVTGIFFYIDHGGKEYQYFLPSGVSPI